MPLRIAVIGSSFASSVQLPGFIRLAEVEDVQVAAVVSGHLSRAQEVAERFNVPRAYNDYRAMLDEAEVDLVSVVTPPHLHHEMVMEALRRGKHVLCEKPFALNLVQAREMLETAEQAGVVHALDHEFRYLPGRWAFGERVAQGYLGEPRLVRISWRSATRARPESAPLDWWFEREKGGGILGAIGSHYFDALRLWFGQPRALAASLDALVPERPLPNGGGWGKVTSDDTASVLLRLPGAGHASLDMTAVGGVQGSRIEAYGSEGSLVLENDSRLSGARGGGKLEELPLPEVRFAARPAEHHNASSFAELAARILARIRGQSGPEFPTFREGAAVQAMLDAAYQAAREGRWVEPETE